MRRNIFFAGAISTAAAADLASLILLLIRYRFFLSFFSISVALNPLIY